MPISKKKAKDDEQSVTSENKQPIKNVPALMGEGEKFSRDQLYAKAIQCYTEVLELSPGNKNALVERAACYLKIGKNELALADAEESLKENKEFTKGLYEKAEALYAMGEFELALVFYHRGKKLRGDVKEFQLGINKAQEAIDNCVGDPNTVKLEVKGDLSYFERPDEDKMKKTKKKTGGYQKPISQKQVMVQKREKRSVKTGNQKTIKQLLGELYADKVYLENLLEDDYTVKVNTKSGDAIWSLANNGLDFLDSRTEFWRQQKPIYARKSSNKYNPNVSSDSVKNPLNYILKQLELIDYLQSQSKHAESLEKSNKLMTYTNKLSDTQISDKKSIIANIYSNIGNSQLELGNYGEALEAHQSDLDISKECDNKEGISRAYENIGRIYARNGKYREAINVWDKKLPIAVNDVEKAWLYHEIGRCYLEIEDFKTAKSSGEKSLACAEKIKDDVWVLNATILIAQSEAKMGDVDNLKSAISNFEKTLEIKPWPSDEAAKNAVKAAIQDCKEKLKKLQVGASPDNRQTPSPRKDVASPEKADKTNVAAKEPEEEKAKSPTKSSPQPTPSPTKELKSANDEAQYKQKPVETKKSLINYQIQVKTANEMSAGTDSNVYISLYGSSGELTDMQLKNDQNKKLFEKNSLDVFDLDQLVDIGKLLKIKIGHDGKEKGSSWKVEFVKVYYNQTLYNFKLERWLDIEFKNAQDKYVNVQVEPNSSEQNLSKYEIHVKTSDESGAGTDANVFITIKGSNGELPDIHLKNSIEAGNIFEVNSLDKFLFYLKDIGSIQKVVVWTDGKGFGSSWKLDYIRINTEKDTFSFNANKWIEKGKVELNPF